MKPKYRLFVYAMIGGTLGSYLPYLWGEINAISFSSLITSALGSAFGIYLAYKQNKTITLISDNRHLDEEEAD